MLIAGRMICPQLSIASQALAQPAAAEGGASSGICLKAHRCFVVEKPGNVD
jgi:hypothetical protein